MWSNSKFWSKLLLETTFLIFFFAGLMGVASELECVVCCARSMAMESTKWRTLRFRSRRPQESRASLMDWIANFTLKSGRGNWCLFLQFNLFRFSDLGFQDRAFVQSLIKETASLSVDATIYKKPFRGNDVEPVNSALKFSCYYPRGWFAHQWCTGGFASNDGEICWIL